VPVLCACLLQVKDLSIEVDDVVNLARARAGDGGKQGGVVR
jgi:hypothetical protein